MDRMEPDVPEGIWKLDFCSGVTFQSAFSVSLFPWFVKVRLLKGGLDVARELLGTGAQGGGGRRWGWRERGMGHMGRSAQPKQIGLS